jgi:hypothetical protein
MSKKEIKIEVSERTSAFAELKDYCYLSGANDFMEVTEWTNLDGFDVCISDKTGCRIMPMTHGELKLLKALVKSIKGAK